MLCRPAEECLSLPSHKTLSPSLHSTPLPLSLSPSSEPKTHTQTRMTPANTHANAQRERGRALGRDAVSEREAKRKQGWRKIEDGGKSVHVCVHITEIALQSKSQSGDILDHHIIPRTHTGKLLVNFVPFFPIATL